MKSSGYTLRESSWIQKVVIFVIKDWNLPYFFWFALSDDEEDNFRTNLKSIFLKKIIVYQLGN